MKIKEVDAECNITYEDESMKPCQCRPKYTYQECEPGYSPGGHCPKYDYHYRKERSSE